MHYWYAESPEGPYLNYFDNVLLPKGNYAARVCRHGDDVLLFNFFAKIENVHGQQISKKLLPPPKRLVTDDTGRLRLKSYGGFDQLVTQTQPTPKATQLARLFANPLAQASDVEDRLRLTCPSGYEAFLLDGLFESFRFRATLSLNGSGKCGMVFRVNDQGDGYYLSFDLFKGVVQLRAWGVNPEGEGERAFKYQQLQAGYFVNHGHGPWDIEVIAHGMYIEVSINGYVMLSLVDDSYCEGALGWYTESAEIELSDILTESLSPPSQEQPSGPIYTSAATQPMPDLTQTIDPASETTS